MALQLSPLTFGANIEIRNWNFQSLASAPSGATAGRNFYSTAINGLVVYNGTAWRPADAALLTDGSIPNAALAPIQNGLLATNPLARANHTGAQTASTISDLATVVQGYSLDKFAAAAATVGFGGQRIANVANGTQPQDVVTLSQTNSLIAAAIAGQTAVKNPVRVYADANITLSGLQTIDGVSLAAGDRVAAGAQSDTTKINVYVVASGAWSVAPDTSAASQWLEGTDFLVAEGTKYGGSIFRQATLNPTITTLTFVQTSKINTYTADGTTLALNGMQFSVRLVSGGGVVVAGGGLQVDTAVVVRKSASTITCDGSTTTFNVPHTLNTTDVQVQVRDSGGNMVGVDNQATSTTNVQLVFGAAQANGTTFRVIVFG